MQIKLSISLFLRLTLVGCMSSAQNYQSYKLPSGKEIKVAGIMRMDFPNNDRAHMTKIWHAGLAMKDLGWI